MELQEARVLASQLKKIPRVVVLGTRGKEEKTLILRLGRREVKVTKAQNALGKVAKLVGIRGHKFVDINICSLCYHQLKSDDGHFHEHRVEYGKNSASAEPLCCRCIRRAGIICKLS